jgi:hypothetical protein
MTHGQTNIKFARRLLDPEDKDIMSLETSENDRPTTQWQVSKDMNLHMHSVIISPVMGTSGFPL